MKSSLVPCLTAENLSTIHHMARSGHSAVIAVVLDLGHGIALRELHDAATAAGARRCHALDLREEFTRECVLPAIAADTFSAAMDDLRRRGRAFIRRKIAEVALLEGQAAAIEPDIDRALWAGGPPSASRARLDQAAHVRLAFVDGVPVSINDVSMSLVEILESLRTIAAAHGVAGPDGALEALHAGYRALRAAGERTGSVALELARGAIALAQSEYATS